MVVFSFAFKERKLALNTTIWVLFKTYLYMQSTISDLGPLNKWFMGLLRTFSCTNKLCIAMYLIMGQPQWSKWKIKTNCTIFFFLLKIWLAPWMACCSIILKSMLHLDSFWKHAGCHKALVAIQKVKVGNTTYWKPMPLLLMRSFILYHVT
jgi:hypothetical protein